MLKPIDKNFSGLIIISGPIKSGKSQLAEFLIKEQESITYIATSKPRHDDKEWQQKINFHRKRRPNNWTLIEHPHNICETIQSMPKNESILIDSLGGLVEQYLMIDDDQWQLIEKSFVNCLLKSDLAIIVVSEEIGWGVVPYTSIGHLFRERLCSLSSSISLHSKEKWLAINGTAIDLNKIGFKIL